MHNSKPLRSSTLRIPVITLAVALAAALLVGCAQAQPTTLRVLTYNIHHGEGLDKKIDLERIAKLIRESKADLVALQEVDRNVKRSGSVDQPARLSELTGMKSVFGKNIDLQGGQYGNAVLSRLPIQKHENHHLPLLSKEQRGLLEVLVTVGPRKLIFCATHFNEKPDSEEQKASVAMLKEFVEKRAGTPMIIGGDFNATPKTRTVTDLSRFLTSAMPVDSKDLFTFPADKPDRLIDYVLYTPKTGLRCTEVRVLPEPVASDHRPVLTVFEFATSTSHPSEGSEKGAPSR